jgi:hypothetical protein
MANKPLHLTASGRARARPSRSVYCDSRVPQVSGNALDGQREPAVGIDLRWRNEDGAELAAVEDPQMLLSRHVGSSEWGDTICLQFIDRYGDAVFNQHQIPVLVRELEASATVAPDPAVRDHVARVLVVLRRAIGEVHTYAWFVGD